MTLWATLSNCGKVLLDYNYHLWIERYLMEPQGNLVGMVKMLYLGIIRKYVENVRDFSRLSINHIDMHNE